MQIEMEKIVRLELMVRGEKILILFIEIKKTDGDNCGNRIVPSLIARSSLGPLSNTI